MKSVKLNLLSRLLCACLFCAGMLLTGCYDDQYVLETLKEYDDRLDKIEGASLPAIAEQITAISASVSDLKEMDVAIDGFIKTLEMKTADLQKQIDDLNELKTAKEAIEAELKVINATLVDLKAADTALDNKIADLRTYVDSQQVSAADWANATFSTLTQYAETQTEIATIKANIEQYRLP